MIHTLTLVVIPTAGSIPIVRTELTAEKFTIKHGTHVQPDGSEAAVGVACADFHDVGVVLDKVSGYVKQTMYLMDARGRLFKFRPASNTLVAQGYTYPYDEDSTVHTGYSFFDFGGMRYAYSPVK